MDSNLLNISKVESFFNGLLYNKLSPNIFFTALPSALKSSWNEMILVDLDIDDNGVGTGFANIFIYARPLGESKKDVKRMSELETKLNELVSSNTSNHYHITRYKTYSDYDSARKLYYNVVSLIIHIV